MTNSSKQFNSSVRHPKLFGRVLTPRLDRYPAFYPIATFPSSQDNGEWSIRSIRQEQRQSQMAEKSIQSWNSRFLFPPLMG